jgi:hypothetical protein
VNLDEIIQALDGLPEKERKEIEALADTSVFVPQPGPQTEAYFSQADVLLFGGSPGGGKTALEVGLALNEHHRALICRKNFVDLAGVLHTLDNILGKEDSAVGGNRPIYRKPGGGIIDFMGIGDKIDSKQGNPHDLICLDEAAQLTERQFRLLLGWMRTDIPGQRCRVVLGSNPPLDTTGDWLADYFAPWLDPLHPNPAQDGELRHFLPNDDGNGYRECEPDERMMLHGIEIEPQSRSFISSRFTDNAYYDSEQYAKSLAGLPDAERERLITGNFLLSRSDDTWQAIPTSWVKAAQARWTDRPPVGVPMCSIGVDVAQGGEDNTVLAQRHDGWFAPMIVIPGKDTPDGKKAAGIVVSNRRDEAEVIVDLGGGWGGDCYGHLKENAVNSTGYMGVKKTKERTTDRQLGFFNVRSAAYWKFREALDPSQPGGSPIALPPDPTLVSDLCTPLYEIGTNGIKIESKEDVVARLGRSPDRGDAVVMAWRGGIKGYNINGGFRSMRGQEPRVLLNRPESRRKR